MELRLFSGTMEIFNIPGLALAEPRAEKDYGVFELSPAQVHGYFWNHELSRRQVHL